MQGLLKDMLLLTNIECFSAIHHCCRAKECKSCIDECVDAIEIITYHKELNNKKGARVLKNDAMQVPLLKYKTMPFLFRRTCNF